MSIRLSICIATLNRATYIGETLDGILAQMQDDIELVVVDGASTDGTDVVVTQRFRGKPNCHYHRLAQKGGVDQDYCMAVSQARGKYCWLFTDDDVFKPQAIATVLRQLQDEPDLLVLNLEMAGADLVETLLTEKINLKQDRDFPPEKQGELMAVAGILLSFIGSVVIRKSLWDSRDAKSYFGTEFVHVGVIFQRPLDRFARVLAEPLIRVRCLASHWAPRAFDVWLFKWPAIVWSFPHLEDHCKEQVTQREPWKRTFELMLMKARGVYDWSVYRNKLVPLPMSWVTRMRLAAIAAFPNVLYNALVSWFLPLFIPAAKSTVCELRLSPYDYRKRWFGWAKRDNT